MSDHFDRRGFGGGGPLLAAVLWLMVLGLAIGPIVWALSGCSSPQRPARARDTFVRRDVPPVLADTIGAQATLSGMEPVVCTGYGLVVGLAGTGSTEVPLSVRAELEGEMLRLGVGRGEGPLSGVSPGKILADPNTAVVLVEAVIPPAAPEGATFDVRVQVLPGTAATSLEGGRLYSTDLYQGVVVPGGPARDPVATARGTVFINPFIDPAEGSTGIVDKTVGRVLNGGTVSTRFRPVLLLDNPSHSRARALTAAINQRFLRSSDTPVARGKDDETIEVLVPPMYRERSDEFFRIIEHLRVDRAFPEQWARRFAEALKETPDLAEDLKWCLVAVGDVAIPQVRSLYSFPERVPRMAALEAGARLGDVTTRPHLEEIVLDGPASIRTDAIRLLGRLPTDPRVNTFLRDLLDSTDLDVRIAAYEALDERGDAWIERARMGDKFRLDIVPASDEMVYVTLQRRPKIVLFGDPEILRPSFVSAWDGRLLISSEGSQDVIRTFYRDYRGGTRAEVYELVDTRLAALVEYFTHRTTPEEPDPGLDFSYSETVGALYEIVQAGGIDGVFVPETDRLALEILRSGEGEMIFREELSADDDWVPGASFEAIRDEVSIVRETPDDVVEESDEAREERRRKYVVPLGGGGGK